MKRMIRPKKLEDTKIKVKMKKSEEEEERRKTDMKIIQKIPSRRKVFLLFKFLNI